MKLKYNHDIFTEEIPLTTDKPTGKNLTTQHGNKTCYAPLAETATDAFDLHTVDDGNVYSVPMIPCYRLYYADGTVETAPTGIALDLNDYSGVIKALSNSNGTITANNAGMAISGKNVSLIGGTGNDVFIHCKGNNTIANYAAGDVISLTPYDVTDIIGVKVDSVNGGATLAFDDGTSLVLEGVTSETPITIKSAGDTGGTRYFFANDSMNGAGYGWYQTGTTSYTCQLRNLREKVLVSLKGVTVNPADKVFVNTVTRTVTITEKIGDKVTVTSTNGGKNDYVINFTAADGKNFDGMWVTITGSADTANITGDKIIFNSGAGNDSLNITGNSSNIEGGAGNDQITVEGNNFIVLGGEGKDTLNVTGNNNNVNGGVGEDQITAKGNSYYIYGGEGNDQITADGDSNYINAGDGSDTISVTGKNVSVNAGVGNDSINYGGDTGGVITFSAGYDTINYSPNYTINIADNTFDYVDDGNDIIITNGGNSLRVLDGIRAIDGSGGRINVSLSTGVAVINRERYMNPYLTYNNYRRTAVTINGSAEAVNGKKEFTFDSLVANDYSSNTTEISISDSLDKSIYVQGNDQPNAIYSNDNGGHSLDGGLGNDNLYSGAGADTFVYRKGNGNDIIYRFKSNKDQIMLLDANGESLSADDYTTSINGLDIAYSIKGATGSLTIKGTFTYNSANSIKTSVNGTAYTYLKNGTIYSNNRVTLNGATAYVVTSTDKANGVTITDFNAGVNLAGIDLNDIKTCSYSGSAITLGLESANVVLQGTNALNLNGATVYVDDNMVLNNADSLAATGFSLTADNTSGINIAGTSTAVKVDASRTQGGITLISGTGNDTLIGSSGSDSLTGNAGADLFVYNGGHDVIVDYSAADGDKISVKTDDMLDLSFNPFDINDADITINGIEEGNSLVIKGGAGQIVTLLSAQGVTKKLDYSHIIDNDDGRLNTAETSIILKNRTMNFEPTADVYPKLAKIDASYVTTPNIAIRAVNNSIASCIIAGNSGMSLYGGIKNDTLISGAGNDVLTGGKGADVFVHSGGKTTITNYTANDLDKVHLANGSMGDVNGVSVGTDKGVTLTFGGDCTGTICVSNIAKTDTVTFASANDTWGIGYVFYNDTVRTASGRGVTLTKAESHTVGSGEYTVIANAGGTITSGNKAETLGGYNVSIVAGTGNEVFLYKGGNMTIDGYGAKDKISLLADCTLPWSLPRAETYTLQTSAGNVILKNHNLDTVDLFIINSNGTDKTIFFPEGKESLLSGNGDKVTLFAAMGDFGVLGSASGISDGQLVVNGGEYADYSAIISVTATQEDSHIVGNSKANTFVIAGGDSNILTGGIKADTYIFESGGGVITDFGISTTKNGENKYLATTTKRTATSTYVGYNRDNPTSYAQATDVLKVDGTVVEIAFRHDSGDYDSSKESSFTAYVTYVAGDKYSTIALANIHKKATETDKAGGGAGAVYNTNLEQMQGWYINSAGEVVTNNFPNILDTSTGTPARLTGTAFTDLFVDKSNSAFSSNIARLDTLIQARGITTYSEDGKIVSVSNGIVAAYAAQTQ